MTVFDRWPVDLVRITQDWAETNTWENPPWHKGIDIGGTEATAIKAPCDGFIVHASFAPFAFGNTWEQIPNSTNSGGCIILQPPAPHTAFQTSFSHLSKILVVPGQWVTAGQIIGYMGTTGNSSGVHLHWECFIDYAEGVYPAGTFYGRVDPKEYFKTVTVVPITTGGKGSTSIQGELTVAEADRVIKEVNKYTAALLVTQWKDNKGVIHPGGNLVAEQNQREQRNTNAIVKNLVTAINRIAEGEKFDEAKLIAGITAAAEEASFEGTKRAIESIESTVETTVTIAKEGEAA